MPFPTERPRRLRKTAVLRKMVRETRLSVDRLIEPFFVVPGANVMKPVASMPGVHQLSVDLLVEEVRVSAGYGIPAVILFGIPPEKDPTGTGAWDESGVVPQAVRALKRALPDLCVVTDVCLCEYTDHGHCGAVETRRDGTQDVANDATLELLAKEALAHAKAGADVVAPSDMMDGRVGKIRRALDDGGFSDVAILSYAAKYASAFYGPFREAAESAPAFGDRRTYQMDPANAREALREVALDVAEGADVVMIKPALPYLDVIRAVRERFDVPVAAYNVSGEYAMVKAAAGNGWIDGTRAAVEIVTSIVRAGADLVLTYHAREIAKAVL
jgi:porphobilinogen synthase